MSQPGATELPLSHPNTITEFIPSLEMLSFLRSSLESPSFLLPNLDGPDDVFFCDNLETSDYLRLSLVQAWSRSAHIVPGLEPLSSLHLSLEPPELCTHA